MVSPQFNWTYATVEETCAWAHMYIRSRPADTVIGGDYMHRWHIVPRNPAGNVMLNLVGRSDEDVIHDHPWDNTTWLLEGTYDEVTPVGTFTRVTGDIVHHNDFTRAGVI